jgi:CubicO group peptidase (beta-lactamase class C family)
MAGVTGDASSIDNGTFWNSLFDPTVKPEDGRRLVVTKVLGAPPKNPPGTKWEYSNFGYAIVGAALERATGSTWERLIHERIFTPLGMTSCGFGAAGDAQAPHPDAPWPHQVEGSGHPVPIAPGSVGSDNPSTINPAGGVHCSLADWSRFLAAHLAALEGKPAPLISAASYLKLHTVYPGQTYTYGAWIKGHAQTIGDYYAHEGSNTMNVADVWLVPGADAGYVSTTNAGGDRAENAVDQVIVTMMSSTPPSP